MNMDNDCIFTEDEVSTLVQFIRKENGEKYKRVSCVNKFRLKKHIFKKIFW